jgi:DNA-binding XRE family transcriptional regulator
MYVREDREVSMGSSLRSVQSGDEEFLFRLYAWVSVKEITRHRKVLIDLKGIGRRIREIRGFGLTRADFARVLGIGQTQLSKYELGQSAPTL